MDTLNKSIPRKQDSIGTVGRLTPDVTLEVRQLKLKRAILSIQDKRACWVPRMSLSDISLTCGYPPDSPPRYDDPCSDAEENCACAE